MGLVNWIKSFGEKVLYYPGCLTKGVLEEQFENYKDIFNRIGIDFILLSDKEVCCGSPSFEWLVIKKMHGNWRKKILRFLRKIILRKL